MGFSIEDLSHWKCSLPVAKPIPNSGSGGKIFLFEGSVKSHEVWKELREQNMDYLTSKPWPQYIVMKQIQYGNKNALGEAVMTKFLGDQQVGPPCTIMPVDSQGIPIFTAEDEDGHIYLFMNRMSQDLLDRYAEFEGEFGKSPPDIPGSIFSSLEDSLGARMKNLLDAGLLFTDIKLENVLVIERNDQETVNLQLGRPIYNNKRDEYFLIDFDLIFACHLFADRKPFEVRLNRIDFADAAEPVTFVIPAAVEDQHDPLHSYPRDCFHNKTALKAYLTIMKGMIGIMFLYLPIFKAETEELKKLLLNLTIFGHGHGVFTTNKMARKTVIEKHLETQDKSWLIDYYGPFARRIPWYASQFEPFRTRQPAMTKNEAMWRFFDYSGESVGSSRKRPRID